MNLDADDHHDTRLIDQLTQDLPESALALRYLKRAKAAYREGTLVKKMQEWYVRREVTFAILVSKSMDALFQLVKRRSAKTADMRAIWSKVTSGGEGTKRDERKLMKFIRGYIRDMSTDGHYMF